MFSQFRTPNPIADIYTVTPSIGAYENEPAVQMVLQISIQPYTLILVKGIDEIQEIPLILDPPLAVSPHDPRVSLPRPNHSESLSTELLHQPSPAGPFSLDYLRGRIAGKPCLPSILVLYDGEMVIMLKQDPLQDDFEGSHGIKMARP